MKMKIALPLLASLAVPATSHAVIVQIDPDDYAAGTDISHAWSGVTLSAVGTLIDGGSIAAQIYSTEASSVDAALNASTGTRIFNVDPVQLFPYDWLIGEMRVDFATATDYVALDFIGYQDPNNLPSEDVGLGVLAAYDASDTLIGQVNTSSLLLNDVQTLSISSMSSNIAYITARRQGIDTPVLLDNLEYNAVPLPASIWLFASGLAFIATRRRRNSRR